MSSNSYSKARCIDDLALVKAAAWAKWQEEFDLSRNYKKIQQQPSSRYNLQVITKQVHQELSQYSSSSFSPNVFVQKKASTAGLNCTDSSLLMPRSRRILQKYTTFGEFDTHPSTFLKSPSNKATSSNKNSNISLLDKYEIERITSQLDEYIESSKEKIKSSEKKINVFKGFLLFRYYKMMMMKMCVTSSYDDVVVVERRVFSNPQSPEKSPAVKFATCRPGRKHV